MRAVEYALAHAQHAEHCAGDGKLAKPVRAQWRELAAAWKMAARQIGYFEDADSKTEIAPSIVPHAAETLAGTHYVVLDDFGDYGCVFREQREHETDETTIIRHLVEGQFNKPLRIFAFNAGEGWARDVSEEIADKVLRESENRQAPLASETRAFVERQLGFSIERAHAF